MNITLKADLMKAIGIPVLRKFGMQIEEDSLRWHNTQTVDLTHQGATS